MVEEKVAPANAAALLLELLEIPNKSKYKNSLLYD